MIKLFVGLGNPGPEYADTRHNAGFWWIDQIARQLGAALAPERAFHGHAARASVQGQSVWLLKPQTFMNLSGKAVHNGLRDIHAQLGSGDYWRLRLGIGHPGHKAEVAAWVLRKPPLDERIGIEQAMDRAAQAFPLLAASEMAQATQIIHTSKPPRPKPPRKPQQAAPAPDVSE